MKRLALLLALGACNPRTSYTGAPARYYIEASSVALVTGAAIGCAIDCPHDSGERFVSDGVLIVEAAAVAVTALVFVAVVNNMGKQ